MIATMIADAVNPGAAEVLRRTYSVTTGSSVGVSSTGVSTGTTTPTAAPDASFRALARVIDPNLWRRPVVLMIDETRAVEADTGCTLRTLHEGKHGLPIIPLFAGLANSRDVLVRLGISRFGRSDIHTIDGLESGEPGQAVRMMLERFRINIAGADVSRCTARRNFRRLTAAPLQWHTGLAEALVRTNGRLASVDETAVLKRPQERRLKAYRVRRSPEMRQSRALLGTVMASLPEDGVEMDMLLDVIEQTPTNADDRIGWRLPGAMTPELYLDHLTNQGALQINADDFFFCPIPSFRQFLVERGEREALSLRHPPGRIADPRTMPRSRIGLSCSDPAVEWALGVGQAA